jgi:hypothetical protein
VSASCAQGKVCCKLCVGEFHLSRRELRASENHPGHSELGRRSVKCASACFARAAVSCMRASFTPGGGELGRRSMRVVRAISASAGRRELHWWSAASCALVELQWVVFLELQCLESWTSE